MDSDDSFVVLYTMIYSFFAGCFIAPPTEFVAAGVTIQNIFSGWLGSEDFSFIYFHIKRITLTLIVHSLIPLGYFIGLALFAPNLDLFYFYKHGVILTTLVVLSLVGPACVLTLAIYWHSKNCEHHPLVKQLSNLAGEQDSWRAVASSINIEFRRIDKFTSGTPSRLIAVTDSWIIRTSTYQIYVAHQSDIHLTLADAEEHKLSYQTQTTVQYLNIAVGHIGQGLNPFSIRLNSLELGDLKEKLQGPIRNARNIVIHQSMSDLFLNAFREQINSNPPYYLPQNVEVEQCIGCMQKVSDVKLQKQCEAEDAPGEAGAAPAAGGCVQCFCRPMWCLECMGKWFASRQDQQHPETWLASRSPCPTCRAQFCVLDVCRLLPR